MAGAITLERIINFLLETPMFGDLDPAELSQIVHIMQIQKLRPEQYVFREGAPGDAWYVLFEGECDVLKDAGDGEKPIAHLGPRACFGEMAILDGSPRSATVRASSECTAFRFPRSEFTKLLDANNLAAYKLIYQMALVLVSRQRQTTSRLVHVLRSGDQAEMRQGITPIVEESSRTE